MMNEQREKDLQLAVRERYAGLADRQVADGQVDGCCSDECCGGTAEGGHPTTTAAQENECACVSGYVPEHLAELPADVTSLSLGCGDPVTLAALRPGERVLDLGSGGGLDAFLAARQVGAEGRVIGVDMTPEMLSKAEAARERLGFENVEFRYGKLEALPVDDDSVDVVMSNCVINLVPDKARVYTEAHRVLAPGGRFSVSDIVADGPFPVELAEDPALWAECVAGASQPADVVAMLEAAGFVEPAVDLVSSAADLVPPREGMPAVHSARITARKPG